MQCHLVSNSSLNVYGPTRKELQIPPYSQVPGSDMKVETAFFYFKRL